MNRFNIKRLPVQYRAFILVALVLFYLVLTFLTYFNIRSKIDEKKNILEQQYLKKTNNLLTIQRNVNDFTIFSQISFQRLEDYITIQNTFIQIFDSVAYICKEYSKLIENFDENESFNQLLDNIDKYKNVIYEILYEYRKEEKDLKVLSRLFNKELDIYRKIILSISNLKEINQSIFVDSLVTIEGSIRQFYILSILFFVIFISIFVFLVVYLFSDDFLSTQKLYDYLSQLSKGKKIELSTLEIKENLPYIKYLDSLNNIYENISNFVNSLLEKKYQPIEDKENPLYNTLNKLVYQLIESEKELEKRKIEEKQKEWANEGKNLFSDILRRYSNDIYRLSDELIMNIVKYLDVALGGVYILRESREQKTQYLELIASYAYDRKKYLTKIVELGEGLVGTVAMDKAPIYLTQVPEDYIEIQSGLGDSKPNNLLIVPLLTDSGLQGVLELASFRILEKYEIEFLEEIARNIASSIESVKINTITVELLKETQKKSEELAENEKRLQETMKEVTKAHEIARRNEIELRGILSGVDQTLMRAEYLPDGTFLNSNLVHRRVLGYDIEQMRGKNILEFIQEEERENFLKIWNIVVSGRPYSITVKRKNKQTNQDVWLLNQYTPIKDENGNVIKILYLAIDITEQKEAELKAQILLDESKKIQAELQGILTGVDNTVLRAEYTPEGNLINSNVLHQTILGYDLKDMIGKNILEFVVKDEQEAFKKMWDEIVAGKYKQITVKRFNKQTGKEIWLLNHYSPIKDLNGKVVKVLYLAIDITEQKIAEEKINALLKQSQSREVLLKGFQNAIDRVLIRAEYYLDGTFIDANDNHVETFGYIKEEMVGKNILEFIPESQQAEFMKNWNRLKRGKPLQMEVVRYNKKTGKEIYLINHYVPIMNENEDIVRILYLAIDITEQKLAEKRAQELLKEQKEQQILLESLKYAIDQTLLRADYLPDGTLIDSNLKHQQILGYNIDEFRGKSILEFIEEDARKDFIQNVWSKVSEGNSLQLTVKRINKQTGQIIWLLNQYTPIFDAEGNLIEILYLSLDITEQKEAEEKTKELLSQTLQKEARLNALVNSIDKKFLRAEYDVDGKFIDSNTIHQEILGYQKEDMIGKSIFEFIPEEEKENFEKIWANITQGNSQELIVKRFNKTTGTEIWLFNIYSPIFDEQGNVSTILYIAIDITEQKLTEQLIEQLMIEAQQSNIVARALIAAFDKILIRAEYLPDGSFVDSNLLHQKIFGYEKEQFIGKTILDFIPESQREDFLNNIWKKVISGENVQVEVERFNQQTGQRIWLLNNYIPILDIEGNVEKILYFAWDLTEQKLFQKDLESLQENMRLNMEDLLAMYSELEQRYNSLINDQQRLMQQFDTEVDKLYDQWLKDFE